MYTRRGGVLKKLHKSHLFIHFTPSHINYICNILSFVICFNYIDCNSLRIATECVWLNLHHGICTKRQCLCKQRGRSKISSLATYRLRADSALYRGPRNLRGDATDVAQCPALAYELRNSRYVTSCHKVKNCSQNITVLTCHLLLTNKGTNLSSCFSTNQQTNNYESQQIHDVSKKETCFLTWIILFIVWQHTFLSHY